MHTIWVPILEHGNQAKVSLGVCFFIRCWNNLPAIAMHADIQAVYCDRRWQAGLRSGATSLFDVRRSMFDVGRSSFNMFDVRLSKQPCMA